MIFFVGMFESGVEIMRNTRMLGRIGRNEKS
jgi:hypothetical protein